MSALLHPHMILDLFNRVNLFASARCSMDRLNQTYCSFVRVLPLVDPQLGLLLQYILMLTRSNTVELVSQSAKGPCENDHHALLYSLKVVMYDSYGGIINPITGQLLAQLPSLGPYIHFEAQFSGSYAPLMMSYENNYTVVELFIIGESLVAGYLFRCNFGRNTALSKTYSTDQRHTRTKVRGKSGKNMSKVRNCA